MQDAVLASLDAVRELAPTLAASAQRIYDEWEQDADGFDAELGTGGICDLIAGAFVWDIHRALGENVMASTKLLNDEQHVNVTIAVCEGVFEVDIPHRIYEHGSMFTWTKRPGVTFVPEDVTFFRLSRDPGDWWMFVEDGDEPGTEVASSVASCPQP